MYHPSKDFELNASQVISDYAEIDRRDLEASKAMLHAKDQQDAEDRQRFVGKGKLVQF